MKIGLFRKKALDKLSSPEQLDMLMQVTTTKGWLGLIALSGLILVALVWSITGSIPSKVAGQGILIKAGGVLDVVPISNGQVLEMLVETGDMIENGQPVALLDQPKLGLEISKAEAQLAELIEQHEDLVRFGNKEVRMQKGYFVKQTANLNYSVSVAEEQLRWLTEKINVQEGLLEKGLITRQTLLNTKQSYFTTQENRERLKNDLNQIVIQEHALVNRKQQEQLGSQLRINDAERRLESLKRDFELSSYVISPYSGRILEILVEKGSVVYTGRSIMRLDLIGQEADKLEAVLYIPPAEGKKIKPGMEIQIEPSTVHREEFGYMMARVISVAEFPATQDGMMKVVKNMQLVDEWSATGAPFEVYAELTVSDQTFSGFQWSSSSGPPIKINTGTICNSSIIVRNQRPMSLVMPLFREYSGI